MITGIYEFGFFWSKNGRFVTHNCFSKKGPESTIFVVFSVCALFGPSCQKRENLDTQPKRKKKIFKMNEKLIFEWEFFLVFFCFFFFFVVFFVVCHLTWP